MMMTTDQVLLLVGEVAGLATRATVTEVRGAAASLGLTPGNRALVECVARFREDLAGAMGELPGRPLHGVQALEAELQAQALEEFARRLAGVFIVDNYGRLRYRASINELPEIKRLGDVLGVAWGAGAPIAPPPTEED